MSPDLLPRDGRLDRAAEATRRAWAGDLVAPWTDLAESTKRVYRDLAAAAIAAFNEAGADDELVPENDGKAA